ncbi:adenylyl cyclase X E-like [Scaptodrosophila lebanonensis]|uniref:adenylate cyclase n=1 Tax=Drosophila lebanonensis TaxID=7225 RepID=A0A6J2TC20_DROLE|nr:adenylyl cyclase X E-like [Scaptodrosophila lebanonensis]
MYHYYAEDIALGSFYDTYVLFMIYMFLPIPFIKPPLALGISVSMIYTGYFVYFMSSTYHYELTEISTYDYMSLDVAHYVCFNLLGAFFRYMSEIIIRSSFLDRHQYVLEDIWLRNARKQELKLLHNILPPQIARPIQDYIRNRIIADKDGVGHPNLIFERIISIQLHPLVSILYADVVNYTYLTTTLSVETLVSLLHDLYARFDMAAIRFKVQRIKFLGDCYYCVAGLVRSNPDHAKSCVELGLSMIRHIREVRYKSYREEWKVDIDMRIGVHSGDLFAGVVGKAKLQYDVWGTDVKIANRLESTGRAGYVHISKQVLHMLGDEYEVEPGPEGAVSDEFLKHHNIVTYLIKSGDPEILTDSTYSLKIIESWSVIGVSRENSLYDSASVELHNELHKMPVGGLKIMDLFSCKKVQKVEEVEEEEEKFRDMSLFWLHFRDPSHEWNYMRQPDYMFKISILLAWFIGVSLVVMQLIDQKNPSWITNVIDVVLLVGLSTLLFITWYKTICYCRHGDRELYTLTYSLFSHFIFRSADYIQKSLVVRMCIYMYVIIVYFAILSIMLAGCSRDEYEVLMIDSKLYHYDLDANMCFHPWVMSNMVSLIIGMSFIFTRIPFMAKTLVGGMETIIYMVLLFFQFEFIFHHSPTTNPFFFTEYAHSMLIVMTLVSMYLMERQTEFNNKVNFSWRVELMKKQRDAHLTNESILIMLNNILPSHVVNVYLTSLAKGELYYENYDMVAVMFASIKDFNIDLANLRLLNEIISEFDKLLSFYKDYYMVEKIKIVSCTYMAACGLDLALSDGISREYGSIKDEVERARQARASLGDQSQNNEEVVFVLTTFALDMMRTLWAFNNLYLMQHMPYDRALSTGIMSIGISCGQVMAGVVGASQPHYDIWGDPVNMASRMDSTGVPGKIQVTENTALILREFGIQCNYRGMTMVKGRGQIPTYFVGIDEDYYFKNHGDSARRPRHGDGQTRNFLLEQRESNAVPTDNIKNNDFQM